MTASERLIGKPLWKKLDLETKAGFHSLIGPLTDDPTSLGASLLLLTRVFVDGIEPEPLKAYLKEHEPGERSLSLLWRFASELGDTSDVTAILKELYSSGPEGESPTLLDRAP
jgi:hypothetical protein